MEKSQINATINFLKAKRELFETNFKEFFEHRSPSFSPLNSEFNFNLEALKEEVIQNFSYTDYYNVNSYYLMTIADLKNDAFVKSRIDDSLVDDHFNFENRESFLRHYYSIHPIDSSGEGEIEYIRICFTDFLYNYKVLVQNIIEIIESIITYKKEALENSTIKNDLTTDPTLFLNKKLTDDDIYEIITKEIGYLYDGNAEISYLDDKEYDQLKTAIFEMVKYGRVPEYPVIKKHPCISIKSFRRNIYNIHAKTTIESTNKIRPCFIDFSFVNLRNLGSTQDKKSIRKKFSE